MQALEVAEALAPGIKFILDHNISLDTSMEAFRRLLVREAIHRGKGNGEDAAALLRTTRQTVNSVLRGGRRRGRGPRIDRRSDADRLLEREL